MTGIKKRIEVTVWIKLKTIEMGELLGWRVQYFFVLLNLHPVRAGGYCLNFKMFLSEFVIVGTMKPVSRIFSFI